MVWISLTVLCYHLSNSVSCISDKLANSRAISDGRCIFCSKTVCIRGAVWANIILKLVSQVSQSIRVKKLMETVSDSPKSEFKSSLEMLSLIQMNQTVRALLSLSGCLKKPYAFHSQSELKVPCCALPFNIELLKLKTSGCFVQLHFKAEHLQWPVEGTVECVEHRHYHRGSSEKCCSGILAGCTNWCRLCILHDASSGKLPFRTWMLQSHFFNFWDF